MSYTAEDYKEQFGLGSREGIGGGYNRDAGATDGDGTKSHSVLGQGYLSNDDYKRLLSDENFQKAYAEKNDISGQDNAFDEGSLTIDQMDSFFDGLSEKSNDTSTPAPVADKPIEYSPELQQAHDRVNQWESDVWSGEQSQSIFGRKQSVADGAPSDLGKQQQEAAQNLAANYADGIKRNISEELSQGIRI